ncbi:MAG: RelA/SpoT family protein, partial [Calditrichia bacterium]|nr:RelA/SpoT family protein [Calditrichia bacterium]
MMTRNKPFDEIYDMFAVRVILDTEENNACFTVYGIVSEIYKPIPERFKNYISIPKKNGYQSLHTTVVGPEGKMVEVQIRTRQMHEIAERGVAAHWYYTENGSQAPLDRELENWINWVREMFDQKQGEDVSPKELIESFKLNLYQDEIYVFTPKGDL